MKSLMKKLVPCFAVLCLAASVPSWAAEAEPEKAHAEKRQFLDRFDVANDLFSKGKVREAATAYKALLREGLKPPTWGKVTFNLGIAHMKLSEYDEAIHTFETIFASKVDDREPGGNLMEEFRNYRYQACLKISRCYESKGDIPRALSFAIRARDDQKYQAHCGNCAMSASEALQDRIDDLGKKKKQKQGSVKH